MSKNKHIKILREVKEANQDFEWYPTTNEILDALYFDVMSNHKDRFNYQNIDVLDIGAGDCKLLHRFRSNSKEHGEFDSQGRAKEGTTVSISKYMAIEKSQILINNMPPEVFIVGTDFHENFLVDKKTDIVFCNPPYSEYEKWTERIIKESNAEYIYLVIPKRWGNNPAIANAIKHRNAQVKIVGDFDFLSSEDRKARAVVSLVKICLKKKRMNGKVYDTKGIDPFESWIDETFDFQKAFDEKRLCDDVKAKNKSEEIKNQLVNATDLVSSLFELYNKDMERLVNNYKKVSELDAEILEELNVSVQGLKSGLKEKIVGLKHLYWKEVFDNLTDITKRLTNKSRDSLVSSLNSNTNIDFTRGNIRSVVIWVIKNANKYYDQQMLEVYDAFTSEEGAKLYKSNKHWTHDSWRYAHAIKEQGIKYALDYRIVRHGWLSEFDVEYNNRISEDQQSAIRDVIVIAKNLGFSMNENNSSAHDIARGEKKFLYFNAPRDRILKKGTKVIGGKIDEVYVHTNIPNSNGERVHDKNGVLYVYDDNNEKEEVQYKIGEQYYNYQCIDVCKATDVFTTVKGFKNGNVHFQFNKEFIKKLNLEVGRLRGWIKSPQEAAEEFDISVEEANAYWESNFVLLPSHVSNLLPQTIKKEEPEVEEEFTCSNCANPLESKEAKCDLCASNDALTIDAEPLVASSEDTLYDDSQKETFSNGTLF